MALKRTSDSIQISASTVELAPNTPVFHQIDLQLNALDNEVFVVTMLQLDPDAPDLIAGASTSVDCSVSTTLRPTVGTLAASNVLATSQKQIIMNGASVDGCPFQREDPTYVDPIAGNIGIVATSNVFLNIVGTNNGNPKAVQCRIYGYRAKASSSVYAALVQSELLS